MANANLVRTVKYGGLIVRRVFGRLVETEKEFSLMERVRSAQITHAVPSGVVHSHVPQIKCKPERVDVQPVEHIRFLQKMHGHA